MRPMSCSMVFVRGTARFRRSAAPHAWRVLGAVGVGIALASVPTDAGAELPLPTFPSCGEAHRPDLCPADLDEDWEFLSYIPSNATDSILPSEADLGSGMWVDRAWRTTTGRTDVVLAVGDSGVEWQERSLVRKYALNALELPLPQLADGSTAAAHDANGDGIFNIDDYAEDTRVDPTAGVDAADGLLDPSDLIYTFSDGVDDDANGYTDDICGWDFFGRDNDAYNTYTGHDYGTHGAGVAKSVAAEGGDEENGNIGICPNCMILPVRLGDTFITDGTRAGEGIVFAVEHGAVGMTLAIGALTNPDVVQSAARLAYDQGLTLIGAAGDENAYHRNFPAALPDILFVHSIRYDTPSEDSPVESYQNTWNCNNYGARMDVVAPSSACATGAVANITGMVGLIYSAARDAGVDLTPGELRQVVRATADDIWKTESERAITNAYPSAEGWDPFFGYGRVNAAAAVEAVAAGDIPPAVHVSSPDWFEPVHAAAGSIVVEGRISALRSDHFSWQLEVGRGNAPSTWSTVASGSGSGDLDGFIAEVDLSPYPWMPVARPDIREGIMERMERVNVNQLTLRLQVTDAEGRVGEERRAVSIEADPDLLPGYPFALGASGEASPILVDLNGDGVLEIIVSGTDGTVHALTGGGTALPGWPVSVDVLFDAYTDAASYVSGLVPVPREGIIASAGAGDIDGDGEPEVVVATLAGRVFAWNADGSVVDGWPVEMIGRAPEEFDANNTYDRGFVGAPAIVDLDGDGAAEVIAIGMDSRAYVWAGNGEDFGPYPVDVCYPTVCDIAERRSINSPAVGDVDGDGDYEIVFGTNESPNDGRLSATHNLDALTGEPSAGWPIAAPGLVNEAVLLPLLGEGHPGSVALADIDADGDLEMLSPVMFGTTGIIDHTGATVLELSYFGEGYGAGANVDLNLAPAFVQFATNPSFGDMDLDGLPDPLLGGGGTMSLVALAMSQWKEFQQPVGGWSSATGNYLPGWPRQVEDFQFLLAPAVADISGDGIPEAIYGSAGNILHAWDAIGNSPSGWPKNTGHWILGSPAVGDIDGDGYLDVVVSTREGYVFAWSTQGRADQKIQWASQFHDAGNTGNYEVAIATQAGPVPVEDEPESTTKSGGCCSDDESDSSSALLLVIPVGLLGIRRRREGVDKR